MKICIDPGHGGDDSGAAYGFSEEDDINLLVGYFLRCALEKHGVDVIMTREKDNYVSLQNRCDIANNADADLFISIHCDAWHNKTTSGMSTHMYRNAGAETAVLAKQIHAHLIGRFPDHVNRGVNKAGFYVLKHTKMPAVLVECEFISNPDMRKFLHEPENLLYIADAIADAIKVQLT